MHEATRMLREEHEVILRVSDVTEVMANAIESGAEPPAQFSRDLVEFLRWYEDRQHHGKEEDLLFSRTREERYAPKWRTAVGMMLMEHQFGRVLIAKNGGG